MDIADWLRELGLERYEAAFRENDIAPAVLPELTDQDLQELGVSLVLEAGLGFVAAKGELLWEPDLHRLKGDALLLLPTGQTSAEASYISAIEVARGQGARLAELRAATSLAQLRAGLGKRDEAHDLLAPIYAWFTEGFDSADLRDAKALLDELA